VAGSEAGKVTGKMGGAMIRINNHLKFLALICFIWMLGSGTMAISGTLLSFEFTVFDSIEPIRFYQYKLSTYDEGNLFEKLSIECTSGCEEKINFSDDLFGPLQGAWISDKQLFVLSTGGSADIISVYLLARNGVKKSFDSPTDIFPILTRTKDGKSGLILKSGHFRPLSEDPKELARWHAKYDKTFDHLWVWNGAEYIERDIKDAVFGWQNQLQRGTPPKKAQH
jgi:hypothetical protein